MLEKWYRQYTSSLHLCIGSFTISNLTSRPSRPNVHISFVRSQRERCNIKPVNTKTSKNEPLKNSLRQMVKAMHIFSTFMYWIFYYLQLNLKSISSKCIPQFTTSNLLSSPFARGEYCTRWKSPRLTRRNNTCMAILKCLQTSNHISYIHSRQIVDREPYNNSTTKNL